MDIYDIERAAMLFYQMCREHPEICPHDYSLKLLRIDNEKKIATNTYECLLCGNTMELMEPIKKMTLRRLF